MPASIHQQAFAPHARSIQVASCSSLYQRQQSHYRHCLPFTASSNTLHTQAQRLAAQQRWSRSHQRQRRQCIAAAASQDSNETEDAKHPAFTAAAGRLLVLSGTLGSVALGLGWLLHIDPYGHLHWDQQAVLRGLLLSLPVFAFDALLMLPGYSPQREAQHFDVPIPLDSMKSSKNNVAETMQPAGCDEATTSRNLAPQLEGQMPAQISSAEAAQTALMVKWEVMMWREQPIVVAALERAQALKTADGLKRARALPLPLDVGLLLLQRFTREMAFRAILLGGLGAWITDRLFEMGYDDSVRSLHGPMPTRQFGMWLALVACAAFVNGTAVATVLRNSEEGPKESEAREKGLEKAAQLRARFASESQRRALLAKLTGASPKPQQGQGVSEQRKGRLKKAMRSMRAAKKADPVRELMYADGFLFMARNLGLRGSVQPPTASMRQFMEGEVELRRKWQMAIDATGVLTRCICFGGAFVATGNLASSLAASLASSLLLFSYQHLKFGRLEADLKAKQKTLVKLRQLSRYWAAYERQLAGGGPAAVGAASVEDSLAGGVAEE